MGRFLDTLRERVVIFDGATGTNLQQRELGADDFGGPALEGCNEILAVTRPAVIAELHRSFFDVGVDAVETDTFGAFPVVLAEYGIAERTFELNEAAARIAKEVASGYSTPDRPRWVVGSIGPGTKLPSLGQIDFVALRDGYEAQVAGLLAGGVERLAAGAEDPSGEDRHGEDVGSDLGRRGGRQGGGDRHVGGSFAGGTGGH